MSEAASSNSKLNYRYKPKILIMLMICLSVLMLFQATPLKVYAEETSTSKKNGSSGSGTFSQTEIEGWDLNGTEENGKTRKVSYLYQAGSTARTGYLFYIIDQETQQIVRGKDFGLSGAAAGLTFALGLRADTALTLGVDTYYLNTHYGSLNNVKFETYGMVKPITYANGQWDGNTEEIHDWLFTEYDVLGSKMYQWQCIVDDMLQAYGANTGLDNSVLKNIWRELAQNEKYVIVIEPISSQAIYGNKSWGSNIDTSKYPYNEELKGYEFSNDEYSLDYGYLFKSTSPKPVINEWGEVKKILTTGVYASTIHLKLAKEQFGISSASQMANKTWLCEALPFSMTLDEDQAGVNAMKDDTHFVNPSEVYTDYGYFSSEIQSRGYAICMLESSSMGGKISTYDNPNSPTNPAPAEEPVSTTEKDTTGDCTIHKVYFDIVKDYKQGTYTVTYKGIYTRKNTTYNVKIEDELEKTGYQVEKWATTWEEVPNYFYSLYENWSPYFSSVAKQSGTGPRDELVVDAEQFQSNVSGGSHLYIRYIKTTIIPPDPIEDEDFELPESYLTRQIYFSKGKNTSNTSNIAANLQSHTFTWNSDSHITCPTHIIKTCTQREHTHIPWVSQSFPGCYSTTNATIYSCSNTTYCTCTHTQSYHNTYCTETQIKYICTRCGEVYGSLHESNCPQNGTVNTSITQGCTVPIDTHTTSNSDTPGTTI